MTETLVRPAPCSVRREAPPVPRGAAPPAPQGRLLFVDGLRGVAMLMVLSYHCWYHTSGMKILMPLGPWQFNATKPFRYGYLGVHLFIVLSGFCLTYPLLRKGMNFERLDLKRFFQRRAWRILPPYYAALALFSVLPALERVVRASLNRPDSTIPEVTVGQVVSHMFMVHNLAPGWLMGINGSFWSLALECQLYLLFPLLVWGFRRWGADRTVAAVLALTLSYRTWVYFSMDTSQEAARFLFAYALPGRMFEFVLGMKAAVLLAGWRQAPPQSCSRRYLLGAVALAVLGFAVSRGWDKFSPITDVLWGLMFYCVVLYAGSGSAAGARWLTSRLLVTLGVISYSVYLIHEPLIQRGYAALHSYHHSPVVSLLVAELVAAPLLIAVGWLFFRLVEARILRVRSHPA